MHYAYHHPQHGLKALRFQNLEAAESFAVEIGPRWQLLPGDIHTITIGGGRTGHYARKNGQKPGPTAACYDTPEEAAPDLLLWSQGKDAREKESFYGSST